MNVTFDILSVTYISWIGLEVPYVEGRLLKLIGYVCHYMTKFHFNTIINLCAE